MDTNVQALKGLYAALNGDPKDVENMATSSEVITALQDVAAAAATELPVVKKVDEGKVLTVNGNGKWSAALPETEIDDTEASATKTYSSSKIESIIPANELPTPSVSNNGKVAMVVSDGEGGYTWGAETPSSGIEYFDISVTGTIASPVSNKTFAEIKTAYQANKVLRTNFNLSDSAIGTFSFCNYNYNYDDSDPNNISEVFVFFGLLQNISGDDEFDIVWLYITDSYLSFDKMQLL